MDALSAMQYGFAPALASALIHSLWQVKLLAVAAALALAAMARASAAARHTVALLFQVTMVLVPATRFVQFWQQPAEQVNAGLLPAMTTMRLNPMPGALVQESSPVAMVVVLLWALGAGLMLLRHAGGLRAVRRMELGSYGSLPPQWQQRVRDLRVAMGIAREVAVRLSNEVVTPCAARLRRPVIWLPLSLLTRMPQEQLEALLAHELAHIARMDWLWNGLQCAIESLLFFHPAAWWLGRRVRQEREHACDDLAVAACGDAIALAEALTALERERHSTPRLVLTARGGSLMQRITRLLSTPSPRARWMAPAALGALLVSGVALVSHVGNARDALPHVHIRATTEGALRPGDVREITAKGLDKKRYYRASVGADGRLVELYQEDDKTLPINLGVRRWLAEIARMSVPPPPPAPPAVPTGVAAPPAPPAPPMPPRITESAEFKAVLQLVAADPGVIARLGTPVAATSEEVSGNLRRDDLGDADADLRFGLAGPKGKAKVDVSAHLRNGRWTLETLDLD